MEDLIVAAVAMRSVVGKKREGMIFAELKKDTLQRVRESPRGFFLRKRRPELYHELAG